MGDIAGSVVEEIKLLHPERELQLEVSSRLDGEWDVHRAEQVLSNLLSNAIQHGTGAVAVSVSGEGPSVIVKVRNHGVIPRDLLPTIFQPFRRGNGSSAGLGLGLYIVREILRAHGGVIDVVSSAEEGTTFTSVWPRRPVTESRRPPAEDGSERDWAASS
jgi:signal transduction histidine kinase